MEYEEKISEIFSKEVADLLVEALSLLNNVHRINIHYKLQLIVNDKFIDCAFAGNVHYLVTNDKHFNILKNTEFPKINIIKAEEFKKLLESI